MPTKYQSVKVTVKVDGELEYEYERTLLTEDETRKLVDKVRLVGVSTEEAD